jgi:hypothetical protein
MRKDDRRLEEHAPAAPRKPYVKPSFRAERTFETMALSCGKVSTTQGQCHMVLKHS